MNNKGQNFVSAFDSGKTTGKLLVLMIAVMVALVPLFAMITPTSGITVSTQDASDKLTYQYNQDLTATVSGYSGDFYSEIKVHIDVPETIINPSDGKTYKVTAIGENAFYNCNSLESITLPKGIKTIDSVAFAYCSSLRSITLSDGLESIGASAFTCCYSLESITIPNTVTSIESSAFYYCTSLVSVKLSDNITAISDFAFYGCGSLEKINIPKKVASIEMGAFAGCTSLKEIEMLSDKFCVKNGALFDKDCKTLITYLANKGVVDYTVPNTVTEISYSAFLSSPLKSITIPNSVKTIGGSAFGWCRSLESVTLPNGITEIGSYMFSGCSSLKAITIPASVKTIPMATFRDCISLETIVIPEGVTTINGNAFTNCSSLTTLNLPSTLTKINDDPFTGCDALEKINVANGNTAFSSDDGVLYNSDKTELIKYPGGKISEYYSGGFTIPSTVAKIRDSALTDIAHLEYFNVENGNTAYSSINGVLYSADGNTLLRYPAGSEDDEFELPEGKFINEYAFSGCTHLESVVIPDGYVSIHYAAFHGCYSLKSITIPSSVKTIEASAFVDCTSLETIDMPGVTAIGSYAFKNCKSLESVTIPEGVERIEMGTFSGCESLKTVSIPKTVTDIHIVSLDVGGSSVFEGCKSLKMFIVDKDNPNYKSMNGVLFDKSGKTLIRYTPGINGAYSIPLGVTTIKNGAFGDCSLESIKIPSSVTAIDTGAFGSLEFYESDMGTLITDYSRLIGNEFDKMDTVQGEKYSLKGPEIVITSEFEDWSEVNDKTITISGVTDGVSVTVMVNGVVVNATPLDNGRFSVDVTLTEGLNTIDVITLGANGSFTVQSLHLTYVPAEPEPEPKSDDSPNGWILIVVFVIAALLAVFVGVITKKQ